MERRLVWRDVEADAPEVGDRVGRTDVVVVGEGVGGQLLFLGLRKIVALRMCQISSKLEQINKIDTLIMVYNGHLVTATLGDSRLFEIF